MRLTLPDSLVPLAKLFEKDEPRVLVVVGAGISVGATSIPHASWLGLLKHGVRHLVETEVFTARRGDELNASLDSAFSPFNLKSALQHAELVEQNLMTPNAEAFAHWLESAFDESKFQAKRSETLDALRELQEAGALLLTTNYDSLLSRATGLPPVTWEEHGQFLRAVNRRSRAILHMHGHWQRPNSVVLGKGSYDRIANDSEFQAAFKSLWLEWSWVYVGCGDGLDDPNLGRLLEWGKIWGDAPLPDYFLAKADKAFELANRPDKPPNLISVGYADHSRLRDIIHSITPAARCWPFVRVDADFPLFRTETSSTSVPFPSLQEYLDGDVPSFAADAEVQNRLDLHGWAFVLDVASVGKTTLALRMATSVDQRKRPSFYLDLATAIGVYDDADVATAIRRLSRPGTLLILDNVHHRPELAWQLWNQWRAHPHESKLLVIATRMQRGVATAPIQDLAFFEHHVTNPAVMLRPTANDLVTILNHLYRRVRGPSAAPLESPPPSALKTWHRDFGSALGGFCLATLGHLGDFQRGMWDLPLRAAADWVREKWIVLLDSQTLENILCLSAFGAQELELSVIEDALPYPGRVDQLMRAGLVTRTDHGQFGQYHRYSLREPGWGRLILAAVGEQTSEDKLLFAAAARSYSTAANLNSRLRNGRFEQRYLSLWAYLSNTLPKTVENIPIAYAANLIIGAMVGKQPQLAAFFFETIEREPDKFVARIRETPLGNIASFLDTSKRHQRDPTPLWQALEREPDEVAARAWEAPLGQVAFFLDVAKRHQRNVDPLWQAIERQPDKLVACAWETSLEQVGSFLDAAKRHQRDTTRLWEAIEREPDRLVARMWETSLDKVASFLESAKRHQRDAGSLWQALEREPDKLAARAWGTSLDQVAFFLDIARRHQRNADPLWHALERESDKLVGRAWDTSLEKVAFFLDTAKRQQRDMASLWEAIEREPNKFARRVWETSLKDTATFLDTAMRHQRNPSPLWEAIEREPDKLAARALETPLGDIVSFLNTAKRHQRDTTLLWGAIEREPDKLAARAWETDLGHLSSFLDAARRAERNVDALTEALAKDPKRLSAIAKQNEMGGLAGFVHHAPLSLIKIALTDFEARQWDLISPREAMPGAVWVAIACENSGRDDLKSALITILLQRANPRDFVLGMGLFHVAWVLANIPPTKEKLVAPFLDAVCTKRWLGQQYTSSGVGALATAIRMLAFHLLTHTRQRFRDSSLDIRIANEFARWKHLDNYERSLLVELLGGAQLCGWARNSRLLRNVPLSEIGVLPLSALPHRPGAERVEEWQYQLWLGLRAIGSIMKTPLSVAPTLVEQTLALWRKNLEETANDQNLAEHRVNLTMTNWLMACLRTNPNQLIPSNEPLWIVVERAP